MYYTNATLHILGKIKFKHIHISITRDYYVVLVNDTPVDPTSMKTISEFPMKPDNDFNNFRDLKCWNGVYKPFRKLLNVIGPF